MKRRIHRKVKQPKRERVSAGGKPRPPQDPEVAARLKLIHAAWDEMPDHFYRDDFVAACVRRGISRGLAHDWLNDKSLPEEHNMISK